MKYVVPHDYLDTTPISLSEIQDRAFDSKTENEYAHYLICVLRKAQRNLKTIGQTINELEFSIHENGCIHPFGGRGLLYLGGRKKLATFS